MYCPICGEEVNRGQNQCPNCSTSLDWSDYQEDNYQSESENLDINTSNKHVDSENNSYYKDIDKENPFAPNAGFNSIEYNMPNNSKSDQGYENNPELETNDSIGNYNYQSTSDYQADNLRYDYYDSEEDDEQRKRFIWLLLGAGVVILLLILLFALISRRNEGREVNLNLSNPVSELSGSSSSESSELTTTSINEQSESSQSLIANSNKNEIVYVTPTPAPTTTVPTTTVATTTQIQTNVTPTTQDSSIDETTTVSTSTASGSSETSPDVSSEKNNSEQTTTSSTTKSETPTTSTFPSDHDTYLRLNSGDLPVEPSRFANMDGSGKDESGEDKPDETDPTGVVLPNDNSDSRKLSNFINESLQNINSPVFNGAQVQDRTVQLPNFSHVKQVPSELWVQTYLSQFLKTAKDSTNPFDTMEFKLSEIESFLQKHINPEIKLDPESEYNVPPYEYKDSSNDGVFSIPDTAIEPNEEIPENPESKTTFIPIETVKMRDGSYEVRMLELNYDLRTHDGVNYREITDVRHQKLIGLAIDSTTSVAKIPEDITNDGDAVFFMNIDEMKANLGYVKYTLKPNSNGDLALVSKITYDANASDSDVLDRISEIEENIYYNLRNSSVITAETDIPLINNPKVNGESQVSQISTIRKGNQYLVFDFGSETQFIALTKAGNGYLIGYANH